MSELAVGDRLEQTGKFTERFVSGISRRMEGRAVRVSRIFSITPLFGDGRMVELEFLPPTKQHKSFKIAFTLRELEFYFTIGELSRAAE